MVALGGWVFLMSEVPLGIVLLPQLSEDGLQRLRAGHDAWRLQGYLAHKKPHPPRTLQ